MWAARPKAVLPLLLCTAFALSMAAQKSPNTAKGEGHGLTFSKANSPPLAHLAITLKTSLPLQRSVGVALPVFCAPGGAMYLQTVPLGLGPRPNLQFTVISISGDGKTATEFSSSKIADMPNPSLQRPFATGSDVYVLALFQQGLQQRTITVPGGRGPAKEQVVAPTSSGYFVAHFKSDGSYVGAVRLDVPFTPQHVGVFRGGDFLVSGMGYDGEHEKARLALVKWNGQFDRYIDLPGDIRGDSPAFKKSDPSYPLALILFT